MILDVTDRTLMQIKNPDLRAYAGMYVSIGKDYLQKVAQSGIEFDWNDYSDLRNKKVAALEASGAVVRNEGKSIHLNRISPACIACKTGVGCSTFFISLRCHRNCFYCFNPNQANYDYYCDHKRDVVAELEQIRISGQQVKQLGLTGGEPLLHKDESVDFFRQAENLFPNSYRRLYTCGDFVDSDVLRELQSTGLNEVRFSIRMEDFDKGNQYIFDRIAISKQYIPNVMVEMPVLPDTLDQMKDVLLELERLQIFGVNLLEFCFPFANAEIYMERGYKVKSRPFQILYDYWYGGGLPVARSELECLDLMLYALERALKIGIHYCSVENKNTGQIYQQNAGRRIPKTAYFSDRDFFIKSAKVFGEDVETVKRRFSQIGYENYVENREEEILEFHVGQISSLSSLDIEVGLSTSVFEERNGDLYLRELKVDVTTPDTFNFQEDI